MSGDLTGLCLFMNAPKADLLKIKRVGMATTNEYV